MNYNKHKKKMSSNRRSVADLKIFDKIFIIFIILFITVFFALYPMVL